jgi:hypothetical protein
MATHSLEAAALADVTVRLRDGKIEEIVHSELGHRELGHREDGRR